ncbi:MAG: FGGY-family carbohydrate kinase [Pseudomonadota bacterium]
MSGLSLGIDVGTSGVRTAVRDGSGSVLSDARVGHEAQTPNAIDAKAWWRAVRACILAQVAALRAKGYDPKQIDRICVDGTSGSMVLTDAELEPVTRALMYNSKGFADEAAQIAKHAPDPHITRGSGSALARAMRLVSEDRDGRATHLLHQADYITAVLRGVGGASDENNALKTGYDPETGQWPDWVPDLGFPTDILPTVARAGAPLGPIAPGVAQDLGLSPNLCIHAGTTDSIAAFLAAAPLSEGAAVTSLGTTLAIKVLSPTRIDAPDCGLYSHRLGDQWLVGGASNTGGGVLLSVFPADELAALSERIDPAVASPLDLYPLTEPGERFPINDPVLAPRMDPRPDDDAAYLHGLLEGIARIEAQCYDQIVAFGGVRPSVLFTAGGGAQNAVWTAIRARVLGMTPQNAPTSEASVGVARLALQSN